MMENETSTIISVKWNEPEIPNGIILGYRIGYKQRYSSIAVTNITAGPGVYVKNITGLGNGIK